MGFGAKQFERAPLGAQHANLQTAQVVQGLHRADVVRDVAKSVLEVPQNPVVVGRLQTRRGGRSQGTVHGRPGGFMIGEQEGQGGQLQFRHVGHGDVARAEHAGVHQPAQVSAAVSDLKHVVDVVDIEAGFGPEPIADVGQSPAETGGGRRVSGHAHGTGWGADA